LFFYKVEREREWGKKGKKQKTHKILLSAVLFAIYLLIYIYFFFLSRLKFFSDIRIFCLGVSDWEIGEEENKQKEK
jgi:hypothetical protein